MSAYLWLNNSDYHHIVHIHVHHDFDHDDESTSHIVSMWADLMLLLSRLFVAVKSENFIYFLKECEWRKKTANLNNNKKMEEMMFLFNHIE